VPKLLIPAVLAAGALLTACDLGGSDEAKQNTPVTPSSTEGNATPAGSTGSAEDLSVICGYADVDGARHELIVDAGVRGRITCAEAYDVLDHYLEVPVAERGEAVDLSNAWACSSWAEDGKAGIECFQSPTENGEIVDGDVRYQFQTRLV
jgi:hypothetical protein